MLTPVFQKLERESGRCFLGTLVNFNISITQVAVDVMTGKKPSQWSKPCGPLAFPQQWSFPEENGALIEKGQGIVEL